MGWGGRVGRLVVVLLGLSASGCFVEGAAGLYRAPSTAANEPFGWSVGVSVGAYIEPNPVRIAVGLGGDVLYLRHADANAPPAIQVHNAFGLTARLDVGLVYFTEVTSLQLTGVWSASWGTPLTLNVAGADDIELAGQVHMAHLGLGLRFKNESERVVDNVGLRVNVGPAVFISRTDLGPLQAYGAQVRVTLYGVPSFGRGTGLGRGLATVFRNGYDSAAADRRLADMRGRHARQQQRIQDDIRDTQRQHQRDRQRQRDGILR